MSPDLNSHIRRFELSDAPLLRQIFFDAVHITAAADYTPQQLNVWAPKEFDLAEWTAKMRRLNPFVIESHGRVAGYADLQDDGLIDHFFIAPRFSRLGFGGCLMRHIIEQAKNRDINYLYAYVSLTAQPFFRRFGFEVETQQQVECNGVMLANARMGNKLKK